MRAARSTQPGALWPALAALLLASAASTTYAAACTGKGVELQVLGSGGPELQTKRASSSYLIWVDGKARVLVDSGGGSALRFGESGATMSDLDLVLFTHLHIDHSGDFPALMKSSYFESRDRPLPVLGPVGNRFFPPTTEWLHALFGAQRGAFRYLSDYVKPGQKTGYVLLGQDVKLKKNEIKPVYNQGGIRAIGTLASHGRIPALAWRVDVGGKSVAFSGDTSGADGNLQKLAQGADLLVAHNAVPAGAKGVEAFLHMPPAVIGTIAAEGAVKKLVLSHRMLRTLGKETETMAEVSAHYKGPAVFANDLDCFRP